MTTLIEDPARTPGALQDQARRELPGGGVIEFEQAPAGWLTQKGEIRQRDHRAYYFTATPDCEPCAGTGRVPSEKRPGNTVQCKACRGTGETARARMTSVTTVLGQIVPKNLTYFGEERGIEGVMAAIRLGEVDASTPPDRAVEIVRTLRLGADRARDDAADRGIDAHAIVEVYLRTGEIPSLAAFSVERHGYVQAVCGWILATDPEPIEDRIEQLVCDPEAGYAGRRDAVVRIGGEVVGLDFKTQAKGNLYGGAHLQLRMYEDAGIKCGDEPCDRLELVSFSGDGRFESMPCLATSESVAAALAYHREFSPIDNACAARNREARA